MARLKNDMRSCHYCSCKKAEISTMSYYCSNKQSEHCGEKERRTEHNRVYYIENKERRSQYFKELYQKKKLAVG